MAWHVLSGAKVSWASQHRHGEQPLAVWVGNSWLQVAVARSWVLGPREAGEPLRWVFLVVTADGQGYRVVRSSCGVDEVSIPGESDPMMGAPTVH